MIGTLNMLGLAKRVGARYNSSSIIFTFIFILVSLFFSTSCLIALPNSYRILLTSTSEVYGDPLVHPQDESYWGNVNPIGISSFVKRLNLDFILGK